MSVESLFSRLLEAPRSVKRAISLSADATLIPLAYLSAKSLRLGYFALPDDLNEFFAVVLTLAITLFAFVRLGLYRAILRYMAPKAVTSIFIGTAVSALVLILSSFFLKSDIPRTVPFIYWMLVIILVGGTRFAVRGIIHSTTREQKTPVVIYGAGAAGTQLASALLHGREYEPVAFVDDNNELHGSLAHGVRVFSPNLLPELVEKMRIGHVLLALPSASNSTRKKILLHLESLPVRVQTIAGMADLVAGTNSLSDLRDIEISDLLGRDPVEPQEELMERQIAGKVVMVTGAGGSIGSELCRQIIKERPATLLLIEHSEYALYAICQELQNQILIHKLPTSVLPFCTSVQNRKLMLTLMRRFSVNTIYHAAAYKHVPMVEYNVVEGVQNNVFGTWHTASAALEAGVETFVLISTDKAVRPTNLMGATKRLAELCLQALAQEQSSTRFVMVRFGNVLGSSGSVVPLFHKQIQKGGPVTVTHPDVIRYFMTIPEAAQLVIQAGAMGTGGDVFVLDMGEPVRILDMAKHMIHLMGLTVKDSAHTHGDIEIAFTGLRPGEKLYEELLIGDDVSGTPHPRILRANENSLAYSELQKAIEALRLACTTFDAEQVRSILANLPLAYLPSTELCDLLHVRTTGADEDLAKNSIRLS